MEFGAENSFEMVFQSNCPNNNRCNKRSSRTRCNTLRRVFFQRIFFWFVVTKKSLLQQILKNAKKNANEQKKTGSRTQKYAFKYAL